MLTNKDSLGNVLTKEQIEYFKDTKIVDNKGNLLVCYHGTPNPGFKEFNPKDSKSQFGKYKFGDYNVNYFSTNKRNASSFTEFGYDDGTIYECYINIENPFIVDNKSEAEMKSSFNIKDDRIQKRREELFERVWDKWDGAIVDYSDYRFNQINNDLRKLNLTLKPSQDYEEDTYPEDIEYFDLIELGNNSTWGGDYPIVYSYATDEIFGELKDEIKEKIVGSDEEYAAFSTDEIVNYVISLNEDGETYDGIIIKDILDSKEMFSEVATDIITLKSSNQIKLISNKTPSISNRIDENLKSEQLLWRGANYTKEPKPETIRLYHQTNKDNIKDILAKGLDMSKARPFDNPGEVIWFSEEQPIGYGGWNFGNCVFEVDLPKDFKGLHKVNNSEYQCYSNVSPKYFNALYLASPYRNEIMKDFQNTLDIDKSIERFKNGELKEDLEDVDYLDELPDGEDPLLQDDNEEKFDLEQVERDIIASSRRYNAGLTYRIPQETKDLLKREKDRYGWLNNYTIKEVDLEKVIKDNELDNPNHGMFSRRVDRWGEDPSLYYYNKGKEDWLYSPIRLTSNGKIVDGNHRLWALYNNGYTKAEVLVPKENRINEQLLLEVSRRDLINKSKSGKAYKDQSKGKNRWERKRYSQIAISVRDYNSIDMNSFFKKDILTIIVPVRGETDNYQIRVRFDGVVSELQKRVKDSENKLDYRTISQALSLVFNSNDVYIHCNCKDFTYRFNWWSQINNYSAATSREKAPYQNRFTWTNSQDDMGSVCKHGALVLSNLSWLMKVASVINNYIHFAEENMQRQFADIIFPKIYGVSYPNAVQLGLFDRQYLAHSKGVIDSINQYGSKRGQFKAKPKPQEEEPVEVETNPKQISIFDDETKELEKEVAIDRGEVKDKYGNRGFRKQTLFDYKEKPKEDKGYKGFKPREDTPTINKGFKQLSIFDEDEEEQ